MVLSRKSPEQWDAPEFIKVIYDEKGNPIAVKPAKVPPTNGSSNTAKESVPVYPQTFIRSQVTQHTPVVYSTKTPLEVRNKEAEEEIAYQQLVNKRMWLKLTEIEAMLTVIAQKVGNVDASNRLQEELKGLYRGFSQIDQKLATIKNEINSELEEIKEKPDAEHLYKYFDDIDEKLETVKNQFTSQLREVSEKVELSKTDPHLFATLAAIDSQLRGLDQRLSTITTEISNSKLYEIETKQHLDDMNEKISALNQNIESSNISGMELNQRVSVFEGNVLMLKENLDQASKRIDESLYQIDGKIVDFLSMREDIERTKNELMQLRNQNSENLQAVKVELALKQEALLHELTKKIDSLKKKKRRKLKRKSKLSRKKGRRLKRRIKKTARVKIKSKKAPKRIKRIRKVRKQVKRIPKEGRIIKRKTVEETIQENA